MTSDVSLRAFINSANVPVMLPVTLIRVSGEPGYFHRDTPFVEPDRAEMTFGRESPPCYSCEPFAAFMEQSRGGFVMAGFAGESACLSIPIDAFHRSGTADWITATTPRRLGDGKQANGMSAGG